jgi:hypothetical protein
MVAVQALRSAYVHRRSVWREAVTDAMEQQQPPPIAIERTVERRLSALRVHAADGNDYAIKLCGPARRHAKFFTEITMSHIAAAICVPTPIAAVLQKSDGEVTFGSRWVEGCERPLHLSHDGFWPEYALHVDQQIERLRHSPDQAALARMAVFYGWAQHYDAQIMVEKEPPHHLHSIDHAEFLRPHRQYLIDDEGFHADRSPGPRHDAHPDAAMVAECHLESATLEEALQQLKSLPDAEIARAVAGGAREWASLDTRVEVARYLAKRRDAFSL